MHPQPREAPASYLSLSLSTCAAVGPPIAKGPYPTNGTDSAAGGAIEFIYLQFKSLSRPTCCLSASTTPVELLIKYVCSFRYTLPGTIEHRIGIFVGNQVFKRINRRVRLILVYSLQSKQITCELCKANFMIASAQCYLRTSLSV